MLKKLWQWMKREERDLVTELENKVTDLHDEIEDHVKLMDYRVQKSVMALNQLEVQRADTFNLLNKFN